MFRSNGCCRRHRLTSRPAPRWRWRGCACGAPRVPRVNFSGVVPTSYDYRLDWDPPKRLLSGQRGSIVRNDGPGTGRRRLAATATKRRPQRYERISAGLRAHDHRDPCGGSMVELKLRRAARAGRHRAAFGFRSAPATSRERTRRSVAAAGIDLFGDALPVVAVTGRAGSRFGPEPAYGEGSLERRGDSGSIRVRCRAG